MDMLQIVIRSSIVMRSMASPMLMRVAHAAANAQAVDDAQDDVLRIDTGRQCSGDPNAPYFIGSIARHCDANTSRT